MADQQPAKKKWAPPKGNSSNVDSSLIEKLTEILTNSDNTKLIAFIQEGSLPRILSNWSYFASVNDQSHFIDISSKLSSITHRINQISTDEQAENKDPATISNQVLILNLKPQIIEFYKSILNDYTKVIYRALNNHKPSLTNPTLRTLTNIIQYDASMSTEFLNSFDLTLTILPKLLVPGTNDNHKDHAKSESDPTKKTTYLSIRATFIRFWIALCSNVPNHHRRDLLTTNFKIINNWWKFIYEADSFETLSLTIDFLNTYILAEPNFRRSTKCKILNENFMFKIQSIFNRLDSSHEEFNAKYLEFMDNMATDSKLGLVFPVENLWQSSSSNSSGVEVQVNNKTFRIHNKLIYTLLTTLKPWENHSQLQYAIKILKVSPELVPPYMNWMIQSGGGYHDPTLTSWWVGHTLLYTSIIQLPVPSSIMAQVSRENSFISQDTNYDPRIISENVSLAPLSKGALTRCLETSKPILTQFALQLIGFTLEKLKVVLKASLVNNNQELIELVFHSLPDISAITQVFDKATESGTKLTKITAIKIINEYETIFPKNGSAALVTKIANNGINNLIGAGLENCSGFDLTMLDYFLGIQSNKGQEGDLKWWNKNSKGVSNSFFTSLVKLASSAVSRANTSASDEALVMKLSSLLVHLTENKLIFNKELLVSPVLALIYASSQFVSYPSIWSFLDEVISRAIRTPYKYLDLAHNKYSDTSLYVLVVFEQFKFLMKDNTDSKETKLDWLAQFSKYLIVVGESKQALVQIFTDFLVSENIEGVNEQKYLKSLEFDVNQGSRDSFFSLMTDNSNANLAKKPAQISKKTVLSKLDLAALVLRLKLVLQDESVSVYEELLVELVSKLGNYLLASLPSDTQLSQYVMSAKLWSGLLLRPDTISEKVISKMTYAGGLLNEVLQLLPAEVTSSKNTNYLNHTIFDYVSSSEPLDASFQLYVAQFSWLLSSENIKHLTSSNSSSPNTLLALKVSELALERNIAVSNQYFKQLVALDLDQYSQDRQNILSGLIERNLVQFDSDLLSEIDYVLSNKQNHYLLKSIIQSSKGEQRDKLIRYLVAKSSQIEDHYLLCFIGYSISQSIEDLSFDADLKDYFSSITKIVLGLLDSKDESIVWNHILSISSTGLSCVDPQELQAEQLIAKLFQHVESVGMKASIIPEFANFVYSYIVNVSQETRNEQIVSWLHKSMLYITKKFAESSHLSVNFDLFLEAIVKIIKYLPSKSLFMWNLIPTSIINAQLEVVLNHSNWVTSARYLEYCNLLIMTGSKNLVQYEKLLQIFVNNEANQLNTLPSESNGRARFYSAVILHNLFYFDPSKNSNAGFLTQMVLFYLGSTRGEDQLIKSILITIESKISKSWIAQVTSWEFSEELTNNEIDNIGESENRLVVKEKSGLGVCVSKRFINNTIKSGSSPVLPLPEIKNADLNTKLIQLEQYYDDNETLIDQTYHNTIYDLEFLLMLIIHNEEFVSTEKSDDNVAYTFNIRALIESNVLQVVVVALASPSPSTQSIAAAILQGVLKSLEKTENFKDANIFKVYVSNILFTLKKLRVEHDPKTAVPSMVWKLYSSLIPILSNPGHFLYEKAFRYVLASPTVTQDIPLYKAIIHAQTTNDSELENDESYYRQLVWLLEQLIDGVSNTGDINVLKFKGVFEWVLNLCNSPFITMKVKSLIFKFFYVVQKIDQGSDILITRFGILTSLEQMLQKFDNNLLDEQLKLNLQQLVLRFGISESKSKRIREWTSDDMPQYIKRVHNSV